MIGFAIFCYAFKLKFNKIIIIIFNFFTTSTQNKKKILKTKQKKFLIGKYFLLTIFCNGK
jgi:hypothetical protein